MLLISPTALTKQRIFFHRQQVNCLQITPDKKYIAAAGNPHIRLFEINSNNPNHVTSYDGHASNVTSVGFQKHGKWMFSCSDDGTVKIWDLRAPGCQRNYECGVPLNSVVLHPNQAELLVADQNGSVRIFDLSANAMSSKLTPEGEIGIRSIDIVRDGSALVAANNQGKVFFYKPKPADGYELHHTVKAHDTYILKTKISANGKFLATCSSDKTAKVWSLDDKSKYSLLHTLHGHQRWVWDCAFSAVSSYLVTCSSDQSARLWDLSQGEPIRHYTGHHKAVVCVALNDSVVEQ
jgi:target of rapamycin complex subunit LST8